MNYYFKDCHVMLPVASVFLGNCVMSDKVLLMENTSAGDLVEFSNFDISMQCFGSFDAFCVRN